MVHESTPLELWRNSPLTPATTAAKASSARRMAKTTIRSRPMVSVRWNYGSSKMLVFVVGEEGYKYQDDLIGPKSDAERR